MGLRMEALSDYKKQVGQLCLFSISLVKMALTVEAQSICIVAQGMYDANGATSISNGLLHEIQVLAIFETAQGLRL